MTGYHERSTIERAKALVEASVGRVARTVGELLLFAFVLAWSTFWVRTGWANYTQGHVTEFVLVVGFSVLPLVGWYVWRSLGYLPVERPAVDDRLPTPASS